MAAALKPQNLRFGALRGTRPVLTDHPQLAGRTQVASFARYTDAERTVDLLARTYFPVHRLALVGGDLKLVTEVDTHVTTARAAILGTCGGIWISALMAVFTGVVDRAGAGALLVRLSWGLPLGAVFGAVLGISAYTVLTGSCNLTSRRHLVATRHELHVDTEIAASAWRLLLKLHPAGMTLVDRVPAEVVAQPTELVLIETFEPAEGHPPAQQSGNPEPGQAAQAPHRPVRLPANAF